MSKKIRPCDCRDQSDVKKLQEAGIGYNDNSIIVEPNVVVMKIQNTTIKIPMSLFKKFSEWYLEEQEIN